MESIYLLIPISLAIVALAVGIFFWAVRTGQYDDMEGPAWRILFDDETSPPPPEGPEASGGEEPPKTPGSP
jgi:cbb3-type cytochrome oxidase maturation protein